MGLENSNAYGRKHPSDPVSRISTQDQIMTMDAEGPTPVRGGHSFADALARGKEADNDEIASFVGEDLAKLGLRLTETCHGRKISFIDGGKIHISRGSTPWVSAAQLGKRVRSGAIASADVADSDIAEQHGPRIPGSEEMVQLTILHSEIKGD